jgi:hypothetical protein
MKRSIWMTSNVLNSRFFPFDFSGRTVRADVLLPAREIRPAYHERFWRNLFYVVERLEKP